MNWLDNMIEWLGDNAFPLWMLCVFAAVIGGLVALGFGLRAEMKYDSAAERACAPSPMLWREYIGGRLYAICAGPKGVELREAP